MRVRRGPSGRGYRRTESNREAARHMRTTIAAQMIGVDKDLPWGCPGRQAEDGLQAKLGDLSSPGVDFIVTWDPHLLDHAIPLPIEVVTPARFLEELRRREPGAH